MRGDEDVKESVRRQFEELPLPRDDSAEDVMLDVYHAANSCRMFPAVNGAGEVDLSTSW